MSATALHPGLVVDTSLRPVHTSPGRPSSPRTIFSIAFLYALQVSGYQIVSCLSAYLDVPTRDVSVIYRASYLVLVAYVVFRHGIVGQRFHLGRAGSAMSVLWVLLLFRLAVDIHFRPEMFHDYLEVKDYYPYIGIVVLAPLAAFWVRPNIPTLLTAKRVAFWISLFGAASISSIALESKATAYTGRLTTPAIGPIALGHYGTSLLLLSLVMALDSTESRINRIASIAGGGVALFFIFGGESRGAQLTAGLCALIFSLAVVARKRQVTKLIIVALVLAAVAPLLIDYIEEKTSIHVFSRWDETERTDPSSSAGMRRYLAGRAWEEFLHSPLTGSATVEPSTGWMPHNVVLEGFMAAGLIGGTLVIAVFVGVAWYAIRICWRHPPLTWVALLFLQQFVNAFLSASLYLDAALWCWAACVFVVYRMARPRIRQQGTLRSNQSSLSGMSTVCKIG